jgi:hypothetical protein
MKLNYVINHFGSNEITACQNQTRNARGYESSALN